MYGPIIRRLREERGLTQGELAKRIGLGQTAVANMENGYVRFSGIERLRRIADALGVPPAVLLGDETQLPGAANNAPEKGTGA